ncbi:MAG: hypothetical protein ACOXZK_05270 [Bacteroidales bacterium]
MYHKKNYNFDKWSEWNHQVNDSIKDFYSTFGIYPNILEASEHTHSQIDFLVGVMPNERENIINIETGKVGSDTDNIVICSFENTICSVDFSVNNEIKDKTYDLIYDSEPDWGDNEAIVDSPVEEFEKIKI